MPVKKLRKKYQIKISLVGSKPPIWRRLYVPSSIKLGELHHVIQDSMGWFNCHLHDFEKNGTRYSMADDDFGIDFGEKLKDENDFSLSHLLKLEKDHFVYHYDFGDGWQHKIVLEKILPFDSIENTIQCIAGKRACPPEDCGGIWGYRNLLEVLIDPHHEEHEEMMEWVGEDFDPNYFSVEDVNEILSAAGK